MLDHKTLENINIPPRAWNGSVNYKNAHSIVLIANVLFISPRVHLRCLWSR